MVRRRIVVLAAVAAVVAATVLFSSGGGANAASSPAISFSAPSIADTVHTYGEPDIKVDPSNSSRVYTSGPWGTGTQRSIWDYSQDGGRTFHPMHDTPLTSANGSDTQHVGPGGGDTEISIDHTGKTYYADLAALTTLKFATWDPTTKTFQSNVWANSDQGANGVDRQWFGLWDPSPSQVAAARAATGYTGAFPVNYLDYAEALAGCCQASAWSRDGLTYTGPTVEYDVSSDGPVVVDQETGTMIEAIGWPSSNGVGVAILSRDSSQAGDDPSLTKATEVKIADLPGNSSVNALFPTIAIDSARNVYVVWVTRDTSTTSAQDSRIWQIYYSYATAASGWQTWSAPRQLSSGNAKTNIMPWTVAGSDGRLAAVWYGTSDQHNPSSDDVHQAWDVYLATVTNAASATPSIKEQKATPHPMHYGTICLAGTGCIASQGNRNLADFFEVSVDPTTGAIVISYDDTSNELVQHVASGPGVVPPLDGTVDHRGAPVVTVLQQNGGVGLFGTTVTGPRSGGTSQTDPTGDALFDPIYGTQNVPQLDLMGFDVRGSGSNVVFHLTVKDLHSLQAALTATGAQAVDYVFRWSGAPVPDPTTGTKIPIYYAAVEVDQTGTPSYFAGSAISYELCSVSGCFPHITDYPRPPWGGTSVTGQVSLTNPAKGVGDTFTITVPRSVIGNPADGSVLDSFGAYTYARSHSADQPITNTEAEAGVTPIVIDGVCCINAQVKAAK